MQEGRPNIVDAIMNKEIQLIVNTPAGKDKIFDDSYIRKNAIKHKVPYITTMAAARASIDGIAAIKSGGSIAVHSLQELHKSIH
jgi:carbamoyl-phosphate synthase large subunit